VGLVIVHGNKWCLRKIEVANKPKLIRSGEARTSKKWPVIILLVLFAALMPLILSRPPLQYGNLSVEVYVSGQPCESWGLGAAEVWLWEGGDLLFRQNTTNSKVSIERLPYGTYTVVAWWISQTNSTTVVIERASTAITVHLTMPTGGKIRSPGTPPVIHGFTLSKTAMNRTEWCYVTANITDAEQSPLELQVNLRVFLPNGSLRVQPMQYGIVEELWHHNFTTSPVTLKGAWNLQVNASDGENQTESSNETLLITNNPPQIVGWAIPASVPIPSPFRVNVTPFDVEGVMSVRINFSGQVFIFSSAPYSAVFETAALAEGTYTIYVTVNDSDGAELTQSFTVQVQLPSEEGSYWWLIISILIGGVVGAVAVALRLVNRHFQKIARPTQKEIVRSTSKKIEDHRDELEELRKLLEDN